MNRPADVAMTPGEIDNFIAGQDVAFVAYVQPDGALTAIPVRCRGSAARLELAGIALPTASQAAAILDSYPSYDRIQGVLLSGRLERGGDGAALVASRASGFDFSKS